MFHSPVTMKFNPNNNQANRILQKISNGFWRYFHQTRKTTVTAQEQNCSALYIVEITVSSLNRLFWILKIQYNFRSCRQNHFGIRIISYLKQTRIQCVEMKNSTGLSGKADTAEGTVTTSRSGAGLQSTGDDTIFIQWNRVSLSIRTQTY